MVGSPYTQIQIIPVLDNLILQFGFDSPFAIQIISHATTKVGTDFSFITYIENGQTSNRINGYITSGKEIIMKIRIDCPVILITIEIIVIAWSKIEYIHTHRYTCTYTEITAEITFKVERLDFKILCRSCYCQQTQHRH